MLQPMDALQRDTDLGALFSSSNDAMLGLDDECQMADVEFAGWSDTSLMAQANEQQWSSWTPDTALFQDTIKTDTDKPRTIMDCCGSKVAATTGVPSSHGMH